MKKILKRFMEVLKTPELRILPGQLAFYFLMSIIPIIMLVFLLVSRLTIDFNLIETISKTLPEALSKLILPLVNINISNVPFTFLLVCYLVLASNGPRSICIASNELYKLEQPSTIDLYVKSFVMTIFMIILFIFMIDGKNTTGKITKKLTSVNLEDGTGTRNTLVLSNIEQKELGEEGYVDFSGKVQLIFKEGVVADTSGNKNITTTITLDNDDGDDINNGVIVDVVDPIWSKGESTIFYEDKYVETEIIGSDHYYKSNTLTTDNITVYIDKKDGNGPVAVNEIKKELTLMETQSTYVKYKLKLTNFTDENQGILSIKITPNTLLDMYGNQNKENEFVIRNPNDANDAFQEGLVDFIPPEWHYNTSSIDRNNETVTFKFILNICRLCFH